MSIDTKAAGDPAGSESKSALFQRSQREVVHGDDAPSIEPDRLARGDHSRISIIGTEAGSSEIQPQMHIVGVAGDRLLKDDSRLCRQPRLKEQSSESGQIDALRVACCCATEIQFLDEVSAGLINTASAQEHFSQSQANLWELRIESKNQLEFEMSLLVASRG